MMAFHGIRDKLIVIFVLIKVIPLVLLAWFAWNEVSRLSKTLETHVNLMAKASHEITQKVGDLATDNSIRALDLKSREAIERLTTDTARNIADFLYDRDDDIAYAALVRPDRQRYQQFIFSHFRAITRHEPWVLDESGEAWIASNRNNKDAKNLDEASKNHDVTPRNSENSLDFNHRPPDHLKNGTGDRVRLPLYLEMTYIDLTGKEIIKVTTSDVLSKELRDVSRPENTFCKAESYFDHLKHLKPGEVYVSSVIGAYVKTHMVGTYTPSRAQKMGIDFSPETSAYAGKENPVGKRFQGLVRWGTPVVENGVIKGYVTLALDHTHLMEFSDHIVPTEERYSDISDAGSGNYAFIWDHEGRNISHPRDYFICGYNPETGEPAVPWLDEAFYHEWMVSGMNISDFLDTRPEFEAQSHQKRAAAELTEAGLVGLDCRYLNFAPQCDGWFNLTQYGGSGSFVIFWSGLKKLTTAAAIPYYTGKYAQNPRGFGFVTIGANVDEFHRAAVQTSQDIGMIQNDYANEISRQNLAIQEDLKTSLKVTSYRLIFYTLIMIAIVILIAFIMASSLTSTITGMIDGLKRFQAGDLNHRLKTKSKDEIGELCSSFNVMAGTIEHLMKNIIDAMPSILVVIDRSGNVTLWNQAAKNVTNIEANEAVGQSIFDLLPLLSDKKERVLQALKEGNVIKHEEYKTILNEEIEFLDLTVYPLFHTKDLHQDSKQQEDKTEGAVIRIDNITARVNMEARMLQAEKMKSIGGLAAGMAHEINNPLSAITQNTQVIRTRIRDNIPRNKSAAIACGITLDQLTEYCKKRSIFQCLNSISSASKRAADIVQNMLVFSRKSEPIFVECRLSNLVDQAVGALQNDCKLSEQIDFDKIDIVRKYDSTVPSVKCDIGKMQQVFYNLLKNGAQAMLHQFHSNTKEGLQFTLREYVEQDKVVIEIEDNGPGMDEITQKRIFDPFFTTKTVGMGTGLGLYVCYCIVRNEHNGSIDVVSCPERGTVFKVALPIL